MILIPHQIGIHWWLKIFVKLKNDTYSLDESNLLVTLDSMNERNQNNELQVKNILTYFEDMKHINVEYISLNNIPQKSDNYSCGVFVCLNSYCASSMINDDLSKDEWCDKKFRKLIHKFCLRLKYNEIANLNKSSYSSSLISIYDRKPNNKNVKQQSSSIIDHQSNIVLVDKESDAVDKSYRDKSYKSITKIRS